MLRDCLVDTSSGRAILQREWCGNMWGGRVEGRELLQHTTATDIMRRQYSGDDRRLEFMRQQG